MGSVKEFTDITGASQEQALFYLDSAKGDLQVSKSLHSRRHDYKKADAILL